MYTLTVILMMCSTPPDCMVEYSPTVRFTGERTELRCKYKMRRWISNRITANYAHGREIVRASCVYKEAKGENT